jgi:streptogramin lyase
VTLPGDRVFPESVTSTTDGTLYVGSFAGGGVMRAKLGSAEAEPFIAPGAFDTRSTFGVLADEKSGTLWVCSNDASGFGVPGPSAVKGSWLKGFDLKTGEGKVSVRLPGEKTLCNDIAVGPDGAAYVTNSFAPQILRLAPGSGTFEVFAEDPLFEPPAHGAGLDGLAFGADGELYVDKFSEAALLRVHIEDGKADGVSALRTSQPIDLTDALRPVDGGHAFLMIEGRGKLDRVTVSGDEATVVTLKDGLNGPTGVTPLGNLAWISEGQLPHLLDPSKGPPALPFLLEAVPVPTP